MINPCTSHRPSFLKTAVLAGSLAGSLVVDSGAYLQYDAPPHPKTAASLSLVSFLGRLPVSFLPAQEE